MGLLSLSLECSQLARISDLKTRKHLPLPPAPTNLVNILLPDTAFTCVQTRVKCRMRSETRHQNLERKKDLKIWVGAFRPPPRFSLQTTVSENNPSRKTLETVSDMEMHNNVHNMLHLSKKGGSQGSIFKYYPQLSTILCINWVKLYQLYIYMFMYRDQVHFRESGSDNFSFSSIWNNFQCHIYLTNNFPSKRLLKK